MIAAIIYLVAITAAEVVTIFGQPVWGIVGHTVILIAAIAYPSVATEHPHRKLLLSLALVPLVRIMSLSLPLADIPQIWWYPAIYVPLAAAAVMAIRVMDYRTDQVGLTFKFTSGWILIQLAVALTGIAFGIAEYFILAPQAMIAELTWQSIWLPALLFLLCVGFVEEFIFRGVLQRSAVDAFGSWWGILYVSLMFAILHIGFLSWIDVYVFFVLVIAAFFGWVVNKTGSLLGVTLSHGISNILLHLVLPFFF